MTIMHQLASALHRRDEAPNITLAQDIAARNDREAVRELFENLYHKNKEIQSDCIKVIYETGSLNPALVAPFLPELITLLEHKNNRVQWGAMTALHQLTEEHPQAVYAALAKIIAVADKGSVITNDHCVGILIKLCRTKEFAEDAFVLLNERIVKSPVNQLPMYAENALSVIHDSNKNIFLKTLTDRLPEIGKASKRLRVEKVIRKLNK